MLYYPDVDDWEEDYHRFQIDTTLVSKCTRHLYLRDVVLEILPFLEPRAQIKMMLVHRSFYNSWVPVVLKKVPIGIRVTANLTGATGGKH